MEPLQPKNNIEQELKAMGFTQQVINQLKEITNDLPTAIELAFTLQEEYNTQNSRSINQQHLYRFKKKKKNIKWLLQYEEIQKCLLEKYVRKQAMGVFQKVLKSYQDAQTRFPQNIVQYEKYGTPKIVLKVRSEQDLVDVYQKAKESNIPCALIIDAGRTEIPPNSKTVVGLGPGKLISKQKRY